MQYMIYKQAIYGIFILPHWLIHNYGNVNRKKMLSISLAHDKYTINHVCNYDVEASAEESINAVHANINNKQPILFRISSLGKTCNSLMDEFRS